MKCRYCQKTMRNTKAAQKRLAVCAKCFEWEKKWVKEGAKYSGVGKKAK